MIATIGGTVMQGAITATVTPVRIIPNFCEKHGIENQEGEPGGSPSC
jgi:hypothetical protein